MAKNPIKLITTKMQPITNRAITTASIEVKSIKFSKAELFLMETRTFDHLKIDVQMIKTIPMARTKRFTTPRNMRKKHPKHPSLVCILFPNSERF